MRHNTRRHVLFLVSVALAAAWTGLLAAPAGPTNSAAAVSQSNLLSHALQARDADAAWTELDASGKPPTNPPEWDKTPPTPEQKEKFYLPYVLALADKSKDFYTRFPKDIRAPKSKVAEFKFLLMAVRWGDTNQQPRLLAVEKSLANDPAVPDADHYVIVWTLAHNSPPEEARPLLKELANGPGVPDRMKEAAAEELKEMDLTGKPIDLQFTAVDGRSVDLAKLKGKVVLVDFWATWCPPCVAEVPDVKKTYDRFHASGFEIVGISLDKEKSELTQFVAEHKMEWPQFFDGLYWQNKYAKQFGIESVPTMWLIDKKGNLRITDARENLSAGVKKLLAE